MAALTTCSKIRLALKCCQLILACVCIGLYANTGEVTGHHSESTLMAITFGGFIVIMSGVILGFISGERCPKKVDLFYTLVGLALFVAAGSVAISGFNSLKHAHAHHLNAGMKHPSHGMTHQETGETTETDDTGKSFSNIDVKLLKTTINTGIAMGSIAIINGGFFLFDAVMSYKDVNEYTPHQ